MTEKSDLQKRIQEEMTSDNSNALEKNFDLAKQFVHVTKEGKVDVLVKEKVSGKDQIMLYLIGKLYAKEAGYSDTEEVGNEELMNELGISGGSLLPWLKNLREGNKTKQTRKGKKVYTKILIRDVERTLKLVGKIVRARENDI